MRVEEMIGHRIRARRDELELSQSQLGKHLGELLDRDWPRQAVSAAERGQRSFTAAELVALAICLDTSVSGLLTPRADVADVELSDRAGIPRNVMAAIVFPRTARKAANLTIDEIQETLRSLGEQYFQAQASLSPIGDGIIRLNEQLIQAMDALAVEGQAAAEAGSE